MPAGAVRTPGVPATPEHDLVYHGGKTIANLVFTNFYVGGSDAWQASDIQSIDKALASAMSDRNLNNVMAQYYPSSEIASTFQDSQVLARPKPQTVSQGDVENLVRSLYQGGTLNGFDLGTTVFNFMLPSGTILTTDPAPTTSTITARVESKRSPRKTERAVAEGVPIEEEEDSTEGLGGYHGSIHVVTGSDSVTLYYAVGVYSEQMADGRTNGIPVFAEPWKNVVATFYHELNEARTDPDVEDAIKAGDDPSATDLLGWVSAQGEECGDFPVFEANPLTQVFKEVELTDKSGAVPVQLQYSDADHGPGEPRATPAKIPAAPALMAKVKKAG
jgi:hypothetical protein